MAKLTLEVVKGKPARCLSTDASPVRILKGSGLWGKKQRTSIVALLSRETGNVSLAKEWLELTNVTVRDALFACSFLTNGPRTMEDVIKALPPQAQDPARKGLAEYLRVQTPRAIKPTVVKKRADRRLLLNHAVKAPYAIFPKVSGKGGRAFTLPVVIEALATLFGWEAKPSEKAAALAAFYAALANNDLSLAASLLWSAAFGEAVGSKMAEALNLPTLAAVKRKAARVLVSRLVDTTRAHVQAVTPLTKRWLDPSFVAKAQGALACLTKRLKAYLPKQARVLGALGVHFSDTPHLHFSVTVYCQDPKKALAVAKAARLSLKRLGKALKLKLKTVPAQYLANGTTTHEALDAFYTLNLMKDNPEQGAKALLAVNSFTFGFWTVDGSRRGTKPEAFVKGLKAALAYQPLPRPPKPKPKRKPQASKGKRKPSSVPWTTLLALQRELPKAPPPKKLTKRWEKVRGPKRGARLAKGWEGDQKAWRAWKRQKPQPQPKAKEPQPKPKKPVLYAYALQAPVPVPVPTKEKEAVLAPQLPQLPSLPPG